MISLQVWFSNRRAKWRRHQRMNLLKSVGDSKEVPDLDLKRSTLGNNSLLLTSSPESSRSNSPNPGSRDLSPITRRIYLKGDDVNTNPNVHFQKTHLMGTPGEYTSDDDGRSSNESPDLPHDLSNHRRSASPVLKVAQKPMFPIMGGKHSAFTTTPSSRPDLTEKSTE